MKLDAYMNVRLPAGVYAAIEAEARRHSVTLSQVVRDALTKAVPVDKPLVRETRQ
jgi:predicted HicB family RNase H-like nuclease